tara:strand:- start:33 stop:290 length:258 start_codon:yes stop_codon:yes gene_type:complete
MRTTVPKLRKMIRKVIVESMSSNDPDYESVAEVISQVNRKVMFGQIRDQESLREECELLAGDYQVYHHVDYIFDKCLQMMQRMGL